MERRLHAERGGRLGDRAELGDLHTGGRQRELRLRRRRHRDRGGARRVHAERHGLHQGLSPAAAGRLRPGAPRVGTAQRRSHPRRPLRTPVTSVR
ncbi:hypothetical protein SBRY_80034 [Actinacidiphila bryophytorum]|uniref:Uncharacterized protein n=1 Tax=Actinacidiphila bryophytorum TaxID=1436133 RepID=A0A9W4H7S9_9ACTN|nr:hypothetical protein SBRY_80034 [Actinacidiphila bryophytorum]